MAASVLEATEETMALRVVGEARERDAGTR